MNSQETNGDGFNVVNTGDIESIDGKVKKSRKLARYAVVPYRVSPVLAHLLAFAQTTVKVREYLKLRKDFEVVVLGEHYPAPGSLPGTESRTSRLSAFRLEEEGFVFMTDADPAPSRLFRMLDEANELRHRDRKPAYHSMLDFVMKESGALAEESFMNAVIEPLSENAEKLKGLMTEDDYLQIQKDSDRLGESFSEFANSTPETIRDATNFYRALVVAFPDNPEEAWNLAIWEARLRIETIRQLPESMRPTSIKGKALWIPELNKEAPDELQEIYTRTYRARQSEWRKLMNRLKDAAESTVSDPTELKWRYLRSEEPVALKLTNGKPYVGHLVLVIINDPSPMAPPAARHHVRKTIEAAAENDPSYEAHVGVPILVLQVLKPGHYYLQTDAGEGQQIDVSFAGAAWRYTEIMWHQEYPESAQNALVANQEYLASPGIVSLLNEDRSTVLVSKNRSFVTTAVHPKAIGLKVDPTTAINLVWTAIPNASEAATNP